ncbi:unnamed protein product [Leptosia nina]|uniref:Ribosomal protein L15 n=1 Tax=Leptosia nina TaxID=320188 RepID=A0AAV1JTH9_9NEOP
MLSHANYGRFIIRRLRNCDVRRYGESARSRRAEKKAIKGINWSSWVVTVSRQNERARRAACVRLRPATRKGRGQYHRVHAGDGAEHPPETLLHFKLYKAKSNTVI